MTSPASHRLRSSGSSPRLIRFTRLAASGLIAIGLTAPAWAGPVRTTTDDGVIDWTGRTVQAVGVGTPRIISPTGALTAGEPYDIARQDAEKRIARLLARVPVDATRRLRDLDALDTRRAATAKTFTADESRHFADGTVHLPARVSFAWVADAWPADSVTPGAPKTAEQGVGAGDPPLVGPPPPGPTGVVVELTAPIEPTVRLSLTTPGGEQIAAGTAHDPLGPRGAVFAHSVSAVDLETLVGDTPLTVKAAPGEKRGALILTDEALVGRRLPGAIVIVMPREAP